MILSFKDVQLIIEALEFRIEAYRERLQDEDLDEDRASNIENDRHFLEALRADLMKAIKDGNQPKIGEGTVEDYRRIIQKVLTEYSQIPYAYGDIQIQTVFDRDSDHYLVMILGRENDIRVHGCLIHIDIIDEKIWIQRDGTEEGIANELVTAGIPKEHIVLGFRAPEIRQYTGFAVS